MTDAPTYIKGRGQRSLAGQFSQTDRAKTSASTAAACRGLNRTTLGADGLASLVSQREHDLGGNVLAQASTKTSKSVASGTTGTSASTNMCEGNAHAWNPSRSPNGHPTQSAVDLTKFNWPVFLGWFVCPVLPWLAAYCVICAVNYFRLG